MPGTVLDTRNIADEQKERKIFTLSELPLYLPYTEGDHNKTGVWISVRFRHKCLLGSHSAGRFGVCLSFPVSGLQSPLLSNERPGQHDLPRTQRVCRGSPYTEVSLSNSTTQRPCLLFGLTPGLCGQKPFCF